MAKPTFKVDMNKSSSRLTVAGDLTAQNANELCEILLNMLAKGKPILLSFEQVTAMATSTIQIVYAAKKETEKAGQNFSVSWPKNESILDLLTKTGITKILQ